MSRILLDNHQPKELVEAIAIIDHRKPTEASGSISKKNLVEYAETGVDFISMGALTYEKKYRFKPKSIVEKIKQNC